MVEANILSVLSCFGNAGQSIKSHEQPLSCPPGAPSFRSLTVKGWGVSSLIRDLSRETPMSPGMFLNSCQIANARIARLRWGDSRLRH